MSEDQSRLCASEASRKVEEKDPLLASLRRAHARTIVKLARSNRDAANTNLENARVIERMWEVIDNFPPLEPLEALTGEDQVMKAVIEKAVTYVVTGGWEDLARYKSPKPSTLSQSPTDR